MPNNTPLSIKQRYALLRTCAWAGPIFLAGYVLSWGVMGMNIPPLPAGIDVNALHAHYLEHSYRLRGAFVLSVFFIPFYFAFSSAVSRVMQRIEGADGPMAIVEQLGGATTTVVGMVAGICWLTAAYRVSEFTPAQVRGLHDFGWLFFDTTYMVTGLQMLAMSNVFLRDPRSEPLIPRWLSWYAIFVVLAFLPLSLMPFFYEGAFTWAGTFCYWVSLGSWFVWLTLLSWYMFVAINRLEEEERTSQT
ncbi:hypothetical protein [Aquabacterium sp.]|jgi:hypothetical protein|uniref:hypothetical protein n=1 Tax=Aquabacterium sp. TaxID=1872578 RepID=UPI0025C1FD88|nr:hypothetical protein [Aquabacterium sp.]